METKKAISKETQKCVDQILANDKLKKYDGKDNYGKLKRDYLEKLVEMPDNKLKEECNSKIWLSAYTSNNPRSDYHWQVDACYDECNRRNKSNIYKLAYDNVADSI